MLAKDGTVRWETMITDTEKIIGEITAKAPDLSRDELRALLRRRVIDAVAFQFREGLEFSNLGALLPPKSMIDLIAHPAADGCPVTW
jgi:hypothetical protein